MAKGAVTTPVLVAVNDRVPSITAAVLQAKVIPMTERLEKFRQHLQSLMAADPNTVRRFVYNGSPLECRAFSAKRPQTRDWLLLGVQAQHS